MPATSRTPPRSTLSGRRSSARSKDDKQAVEKSARGASWKKPNWPVHANGELVSALDGNWSQVEKAVGEKIQAKAQTKGSGISQADVQQATRDSVRALMLIRAYRVRGHLHAKLDPLGIQQRADNEELHPSHYGFTDADWDRKIFLDGVLGMEFGTIREMVAVLERTYCQTLGVEFMHISDPVEKAWLQERIEGPDKEITFTREGKRAILNKLVEAEGFEKFLDVATPAPSASASTAASRSFPPSSRSSSAAATSAARRSCSAWPIAAASTCSPR
jgi:2-oxoglutarate dehydrogenase E1 component